MARFVLARTPLFTSATALFGEELGVLKMMDALMHFIGKRIRPNSTPPLFHLVKSLDAVLNFGFKLDRIY
jgi:hypothetical protein